MLSARMPIRIEISDATTAIIDGMDAIMLLAESAAADFSFQAVKSMVTASSKPKL